VSYLKNQPPKKKRKKERKKRETERGEKFNEETYT